MTREDIEGYQKSYLRDTSNGGYAYIKVKFSGNVATALKSTIDAALLRNILRMQHCFLKVKVVKLN